jgi:hypothetical protein
MKNGILQKLTNENNKLHQEKESKEIIKFDNFVQINKN